MAATVEIVAQNYVPQMMEAAMKLLAPARLHAGIAMDASNLTKRHLIELDNERANKMGGRRSHFYARHAAETRPEWSDTEANVIIGNADFGGASNGNALAAHLWGATIYPRKAKALTIPARAEAYGMRAREFEGLRMVWPEGRDYGWLEQKSDEGLRRATPGGKRIKSTVGGRRLVFYWLKRSVQLEADRTVLPSDEEYQAQMQTTLERLIHRETVV